MIGGTNSFVSNAGSKFVGLRVEFLVDAATLAPNNQIKICATLLADVGVRYPGGFAVTAQVGRIIEAVFPRRLFGTSERYSETALRFLRQL
jgi:hypothetical protein